LTKQGPDKGSGAGAGAVHFVSNGMTLPPPLPASLLAFTQVSYLTRHCTRLTSLSLDGALHLILDCLAIIGDQVSRGEHDHVVEVMLLLMMIMLYQVNLATGCVNVSEPDGAAF
jgi:hypothetical protein